MNQKIKDEIFAFFPLALGKRIDISDKIIENAQEIRIRIGQAINIRTNTEDVFVGDKLYEDSILKFIENFSNRSIYSVQSEINSGYITIRGGHRIGISGTCIIEDGKIKNIKNISSLNIRIAREVKDCSESLFEYIIKKDDFKNTLIISPPRLWKNYAA